ncbi:MAG TPA: NAD-dependent epimerase/dehydratase family protein [Vicinamibacteria bacterium]|nr:NAD-dependent epimerase/dehydratase family protein [Vicinamibacteria bacterium]
MKVLVTGAGGFLGGAVVGRLLAHGQTRLKLFVRPGLRRPRLEAALQRHPAPSVEFVLGTLTSEDDCARAVEDVDVVYHLAAGIRGAAADLFLHSVVATKKLLDAVVASGRKPKIVLVSSLGVYGVHGLRRGARLDEQAPLESQPTRRDLYSQAKLRQETLFREYQREHGFPMVVVRPGVIYGPGSGTLLPPRVGMNLFGLFVHLGRRNLLPLTYAENCAEAIVVAGSCPGAVGNTYNLVDDELPTSEAFLAHYRKEVAPLRVLSVPYFAAVAISFLAERYHIRSRGQLPAVFTPYKTRTTWGGNTFSNERIKSIGWRQLIPTEEGIRTTFQWAAASRAGKAAPSRTLAP